jgi:small-conductance mechanosensitive channel
LDSFWDSWINLKAYYYYDPSNWKIWHLKAISYANEIIKKALEKAGIIIPYPHTVITVDKNDQNLLKTLLFVKKNN